MLTTNITLKITNSNLAQTAEFKADGTTNLDSNVKELSGATKSKGIEIDITAPPFEGFNVMQQDTAIMTCDTLKLVD
jgi:iron complex outermembrane receptor protein